MAELAIKVEEGVVVWISTFGFAVGGHIATVHTDIDSNAIVSTFAAVVPSIELNGEPGSEALFSG